MHLTRFAPNHIEFRQSLEEMSISAVKAQLTESVLVFGTANKKSCRLLQRSTFNPS